MHITTIPDFQISFVFTLQLVIFELQRMLRKMHQIIKKLEGTPRAQTSVKAAHQSPHIFVTEYSAPRK